MNWIWKSEDVPIPCGWHCPFFHWHWRVQVLAVEPHSAQEGAKCRPQLTVPARNSYFIDKHLSCLIMSIYLHIFINCRVTFWTILSAPPQWIFKRLRGFQGCLVHFSGADWNDIIQRHFWVESDHTEFRQPLCSHQHTTIILLSIKLKWYDAHCRVNSLTVKTCKKLIKVSLVHSSKHFLPSRLLSTPLASSSTLIVSSFFHLYSLYIHWSTGMSTWFGSFSSFVM